MLLAFAPAAAASEQPDREAGSNWQIVDGSNAPPGAYPWMVALLGDFDGDGSLDGQFCGGSLVAPEWVLTATHCFFDDGTGGSSFAPSDIAVVVGGTNWTTEGEIIGVDQIILHPGYEPLQSLNDVALLHLAAPSAAPTIPLAQAADAGLYPPGAAVRVIGYGTTSSGGPASQQLLQVDVPVVSDSDCATSYNTLDPVRMLCAGAPSGNPDDPGPDSCQGDSGGPLFAGAGGPNPVQIGVVSFGIGCGDLAPGVYAEVVQYLNWLDGIISGVLAPGDPDPANPNPNDSGSGGEAFRIEVGLGVTEPVSQAAQTSFVTFEDAFSTWAVLARGDLFADALGGSALGYGFAPLLFTDATGLPVDTVNELVRVVQPGGTVYILGGIGAIPAHVDGDLASLGFNPVRLAGGGRHETAAIVADEVVNLIGGGALPLDTMIVATAGNWPDAVSVGQISSWWGIPILLTDAGSLHPDAARSLATYQPSQVLVIGGSAVVSDGVVGEIEGITGPGSVIRLAGADRFGTAAAVHNAQLQLFAPEVPEYAVAVNLRRADAFAHVLSASMVTGAFSGTFVALEGEDGGTLHPEMAAAVCGLNQPLVIQGAEDLVSIGGASAAQAALSGAAC